MAEQRCRSCKVLAVGGEVPVLKPGHELTDWHLCGRCWGLLVIGLRAQLRETSLDPFLDLRALQPRPRKVRAIIAHGLQVLGQRAEQPESQRLELLEQEELLLAELQALVRDVGAITRDRATGVEWTTIRQQIDRLRARVIDLRAWCPPPG